MRPTQLQIERYERVKKPCTICQKTVNKKTGLQCNGACKKWVHFTCLRYPPQKIEDILEGKKKVLCPCPDCDIQKGTQTNFTNPPNVTNHIPSKHYKYKETSKTTPFVNSGMYTDTETNELKGPKEELPKIIQRERDKSEAHEIINRGQHRCAELKMKIEECTNWRHDNDEKHKTEPRTARNEEHRMYSSKPQNAKPEVKTNEANIRQHKLITPNSCPCLSDDSVHHPVCCGTVISSSSSSLDTPPHPPKDFNESMINALQTVCNTVGLLSQQIRELTMKILSKNCR